MLSSLNGWVPCHLIHSMPFGMLNEPLMLHRLEEEVKINPHERILDVATSRLDFNPMRFLT